MNVEIITPDKSFLETTAENLQVQSISGELGILPGHAPMITELGIGSLEVVEKGGKSSFFVSGGYLNVVDDKVTVLADLIETVEVMDSGRVAEAMKRAKSRLDKPDEKVDIARALAALKRAEARQQYMNLNSK